MTMGGGTVTQPSLADGGIASCQSSSTAPDAVGTGTVANATQRASAEAAMMAKALASLTAATPLPSSASGGGGSGGGGINKPAILSAILRTAVPGNDSIFLRSPPNSNGGVT